MILVWNARGAAGKDFGNALKELKVRVKPALVVLVETRCSGKKAQEVIQKMGFKNQIVEEARGMSGGIWLLWEDSNVQVTVLKSNYQFVHCQVTGLGRNPWAFTAVYASPREIERRELWADLKQISVTTTQPWMLAGDFNDIRSEEEQRGGGSINYAKCMRFNDNIEECRLLDVTTEGPRYTWRGPRTNFAERLYKKLDRVLCNDDWRNLFAEAFVKVGPRIQSDHHPLLVYLEEPKECKQNRPFRFEAMWLKHKD